MGHNAEDALDRLIRNFVSRMDEDRMTQVEESSYSLQEIITIASLIEEETDGTDQANIASVIYNRLEGSGNKQGTYGLLQIDASLLYALPDHRPHHQRGHADRLYNLYQNAGLPPTPISNPGLASIDAALNPNSTDYYYYALGTDGKHHFSTTLAEHNAFVNSSPMAVKRDKPERAGPGGGHGAAENGRALWRGCGVSGGDLPTLVGEQKAQELIDYADSIYLEFGADEHVEGLENTEEIKRIRTRAIRAGLRLVDCPIRHLGTEKAHEVYLGIENYLRDHGVEMLFGCTCEDVILRDGRCCGVVAHDGHQDYTIEARHTVIATGRRGADWLEKVCLENGVEHKPGTVDIGVRVEVRNEIMESVNRVLYESKLIGYPAPFKNISGTNLPS